MITLLSIGGSCRKLEFLTNVEFCCRICVMKFILLGLGYRLKLSPLMIHVLDVMLRNKITLTCLETVSLPVSFEKTIHVLKATAPMDDHSFYSLNTEELLLLESRLEKP